MLDIIEREAPVVVSLDGTDIVFKDIVEVKGKGPGYTYGCFIHMGNGFHQVVSWDDEWWLYDLVLEYCRLNDGEEPTLKWVK